MLFPAGSQPDGYRAYLVRLWQTGPDGTWRVALHAVQTGEKVYFASLETLFAYLQAQTASGSGTEPREAADDDIQ